MKKGVEELALELLSQIKTTLELKEVSLALENLSQSKLFKNRARDIVEDPKLTDSVKKVQLLSLLRDVDIPLLLTFFAEVFAASEFWLFSSKQFDYFDEFVQAFQLLTEKVLIVNLVTAVEIQPRDLIEIAKNLSKSLGEQVVIHPQVNPAIVGGAQIRIGNLVFDYSLRSKFIQFQRQWISRIAKTAEFVGE